MPTGTSAMVDCPVDSFGLLRLGDWAGPLRAGQFGSRRRPFLSHSIPVQRGRRTSRRRGIGPGRYDRGIVTRRKPDGEQRRRMLCDTAIQLLADEGAKGLSHPKVDRRAGLPAGSTSFYFRTRAALLLATTRRVCELDLADLSAVLQSRADERAAEEGSSDISALAALIMLSAREPRLSRTKARFELLLEANRDPALAAIFRDNIELFAEVQRDIVIRSQPNRELDPLVIREQASATLNFVSGLFMRLVAGQQAFDSGEHLDRLLAGIVNGIALAYQDDIVREASGH
jgi:DNA-binding transcriptional regulator YbjK